MKVWIVYRTWSDGSNDYPAVVRAFTKLQKATLFAEELQKKVDEVGGNLPFYCNFWVGGEPVEVEE